MMEAPAQFSSPTRRQKSPAPSVREPVGGAGAGSEYHWPRGAPCLPLRTPIGWRDLRPGLGCLQRSLPQQRARNATGRLRLTRRRRHEPQFGCCAELLGAVGGTGRQGWGGLRRRVQREWASVDCRAPAPRPRQSGPLPVLLCTLLHFASLSASRVVFSLRDLSVFLSPAPLSVALSPCLSSPSACRVPEGEVHGRPGRSRTRPRVPAP